MLDQGSVPRVLGGYIGAGGSTEQDVIRKCFAASSAVSAAASFWRPRCTRRSQRSQLIRGGVAFWSGGPGTFKHGNNNIISIIMRSHFG